MEFLINHLWCIWLGGFLGYLEIFPHRLKWWIIVVPMVILVVLAKDN